MLFFNYRGIQAQVVRQPSGWKIGSHPNQNQPLGSTTVPSVLLSKRTGSDKYSSMKLIMQEAYPVLSSKPFNIFTSPQLPTASQNHFTQGPGSPLSALKQSDESYITTGDCRVLKAARAFSQAIAEGGPWISGKSSAALVNFTLWPMTNLNSASLFFW